MALRVLLVCGSLQAKSANRAALDVASAHLGRLDDVTIEHADELAGIPILNVDDQDRPGPAVESFRARLASADVVMIACPEYAGALAGGLKNALDWIVGSAELYTKPVVVLSAGTSGGEHARADATRTLTWQGAHVVGSLGIAAPRTKSDADGAITDPDTVDAIERLADVLVAAPALLPEQRLALVHRVTADAGVDPRHIAPL